MPIMQMELLIERIKKYRELRAEVGGYPEIADALDLMVEETRTHLRALLAAESKVS